ncbi:DUF397 domain-containing protein [Actinomadura harenae]|uniref:DUF397 domain-containing protein n=1 Tax=Actinomadura harenae TaxID=2483351 RepID=A0A3M2L7E4_9ACTN|nr:DUF397 domain-containing protein [Actinomadura harenae]RMI32483.1 DUF397 domain-containing protein [Actinomadura harenae]
MPHIFTDAQWRKSSRSAQANDQCVELADLAGVIAVRDSKDPNGPKLTLAPTTWHALALRIKGLDRDQA